MLRNNSAALDRRHLLQGSAAMGGLGLLGLAGCVTPQATSSLSRASPGPPIYPINVARDRVFDVTVCLRPFRAKGPRLDTEMVGDTLVVHNYGHGGSGWSLSWGSATIAVDKAMANSPKEVAVLGCGVLGLTSATLAQRAGAKVTIYAKDQLPQTRSARATASWSPDSRIALTDAAGPAFAVQWEQMARTSWKHFRNYLGLPGEPVAWFDNYVVSDTDPAHPATPRPTDPLGFAHYSNSINDLTSKRARLTPGESPWDAPFVFNTRDVRFNIRSYYHTLMSDFFAAGGTFKYMEFSSPTQLTQLSQKVVINCPGYGGRALWKDESIVPVRGQNNVLIPQPEVDYGVSYGGVLLLSRPDGIVFQLNKGGIMNGYNDGNEIPDKAETDQAVIAVQDLFKKFKGRPA